jgi:hypothetical protein
MKWLAYKTGLLLLLTGLLFSPAQAGSIFGQEYSKTVKKEFNLDANGTLDLNNIYGKIDVKTWDQNRVKIEVIITVRAKNESSAEDVFDRIEILMSGSNSFAKAETKIDTDKGSWWSSRNEKSDFTVDYEVFMPRSANLELANKYGDVFVDQLDGRASVSLKYGNCRMEGVNNDLNFSLGYGNATVVKAKDVNADLSYCKMRLEETRDLEVNSKYSRVTLNAGNDVRSFSKYDTYKIGVINSLRSEGKYDNYEIDAVEEIVALSKYTDFRIQRVADKMDMDLQYGGVSVENVARGFAEVRLAGRYTDYKIIVEEGASYQLEATADYAGISYPSDMNITYEKDKGTYHEVEGHRGTKNARSIIKARLDYGGLKIR